MKAISVIHTYQTGQEKASHVTMVHNSVGFSAYDAEFLSSLADRLSTGRALTDKQLIIGRRKIRRYWKQLLSHIVKITPVEKVTKIGKSFVIMK